MGLLTHRTHAVTPLTPALGLEEIISDLGRLSDELAHIATPEHLNRWRINSPETDAQGPGWYDAIKQLTAKHPQARNFGGYPFAGEIDKDTYQQYFGTAPEGKRYEAAQLTVRFDVNHGYYHGQPQTLREKLAQTWHELHGLRSADKISKQLFARADKNQYFGFGQPDKPFSDFHQLDVDDGLFYTRAPSANAVWHVALVAGYVDGTCTWSYKPRQLPQEKRISQTRQRPSRRAS